MSFRTSIVLYCLSLFVFLSIPVKIGTGQFYVVRHGLDVKTAKNSPAYVAFEISEKAFQGRTKVVSLDYQNIDLNTKSENSSENFDRLLKKPIRLAAMTIQIPAIQITGDMNRSVASNAPTVPAPKSIKGPSMMAVKGNELHGPLEFSGGLALTPDHHIEIERLSEGIAVESGSVNVSDGTFKINFPEKKGIIVARLIDKAGTRIGEGRIDLEQVQDQTVGKLVINPPSVFSPTIASLFGTGGNPSRGNSGGGGSTPRAPTESSQTYITKDEVNLDDPAEGILLAQNLDAGSSARGLSKMKNHVDSVFITTPGDKKSVAQLPETTVAALRTIVSEQRNFNLNDPDGTIIWGRVEADGKPLQGVKVSLESDESYEPVYFNEAFIPQADLTSTSSNGYFAFLNIPEGFQTIRALRNFGTISYDNVIVVRGKVAVARLQTTIQTKQVPVYVYDAFSGEGQSADLELQAFDVPVKVDGGFTKVLLPNIPRQSYLFSTNEVGYLNAQYLYNDNADSIRIPLVKPEWLNAWLNENKIEYNGSTATIIGFVPDEDFEVFLTGDHGSDSGEAFIYFDANGKSIPEGKLGGGFAIFNLQGDVHELIVRGKTTKKQFIKIIPADGGSTSVISFH